MALPPLHEGLAFPPFQRRLVAAVSAVGERYGLALAGVHALRAHGLTDRMGDDLVFATAGETPLPDVAEDVAGALREAGLEAAIAEVTARAGRLTAEDAVTRETCAIHLLREALQRPPVACAGLPVLAAEDAAGLVTRAFHEQGLVADFADVAALAARFSHRDLERLAQLHDDDFSASELLARLEFLDTVPDETYGVDEERIGEIRRFARGWVEDIKARRVEDGDADYDDPDIPEVD
ncbi:hypothetical protein ACIBP6_37345 [Nonomuraea terrae]|uniref:hypothetical protein n=1 Tax=Nonomuraea terrae TaxID=2530383 RepID=UPI0037B28A51